MFFAALPKADRRLTFYWWAVVLLHGIVPALFAVAMGALVGAVQRGDSLTLSLGVVGVLFVLLQVLTPVQTAVSHNLGDRTAAFLYDRLTAACVRPQGMAHLENPALTADLTVARDFDLGMTGPPLSYSMDFIAGGLVGTIGGFASAVVLFGFSWWAPLLLAGAWLATHWLLRESAVWSDRNTDEVRAAQRDADYAYRLAVDPPASKELRLFGLVGWTIDRFIARRTRLHKLQYDATRLRERPLAWCLLLVTSANVIVLWSLASAAMDGRIGLGEIVAYAQCAVGTSLIAFGGLNWALDGAAAPVAAVQRLEPAMADAGALSPGSQSASGQPSRDIRFQGVSFAYPGGASGSRRLRSDDSRRLLARDRRAERRRQDDARQAAMPLLRSRSAAPSRSTGPISASSTSSSWRTRLAAVFQDFIRLDLPLRDNVAPAGAPDDVVSRGAAGCRRGGNWRGWTRSSRAATTAASTCRAVNGSASPWPGRSAPCAWAPAS